MDGLGGRPGWAWIFILEGLLTVVVAIIAFWALAGKSISRSDIFLPGVTLRVARYVLIFIYE